MSFKDNLKAELDYQDVQLKELAAMTGISKNTLGNYLTGHNSIPSAEFAVKIAKALGVSVEYLVTGHDSRMENDGQSKKIQRISSNLANLSERDVLVVEALVNAIQKQNSKEVVRP